MQILDSIDLVFFTKVLKLCTSWWTELCLLPYLRVNSGNCTDLGLVPNIIERLDFRSWILSVTISIYYVSAKDLAADTTIPNTSKVLRTMARMWAMAREILETSEQRRGRSVVDKEWCEESPSGWESGGRGRMRRELKRWQV